MMTKPLFSFSKQFPELHISLSTKRDHSMKLNRELSIDHETMKHRNNYTLLQGIPFNSLVSAKLEQKNIVRIVDSSFGGTFIENVDGLITDCANVFLSITVADCLPIFVYDVKKKLVGVLHAGWRGLESRIISNCIAKLQETYASEPKDIIVGIGPGIDFDHFSVTHDIVEKFSTYPEMIEKREETYFINLKQIAKKTTYGCWHS